MKNTEHKYLFNDGAYWNIFIFFSILYIYIIHKRVPQTKKTKEYARNIYLTNSSKLKKIVIYYNSSQ